MVKVEPKLSLGYESKEALFTLDRASLVPFSSRKCDVSLNACTYASVLAFPLGGFAALRHWIPAFAGMTNEGAQE